MKSFSSIKKIIRNKAKNTLFKALGNSYLIQKRIKYLSINKHLTVLNLHKISEDDSSCYKPLNPELFKELIAFLKENYYITKTFCIPKTKPLGLLLSRALPDTYFISAAQERWCAPSGRLR